MSWLFCVVFFFSSRRRHARFDGDWSSDVCSSDLVDTIVDLRRNLVMAESRFPTEAGALLRNLGGAGTPWGMPQAQRADWAEGMDVRVVAEGDRAPEYLYWVGCAGSFDDRGQGSSRAGGELVERARGPRAP